MLFTPSLGLFDCLHHGRLAAIDVKEGEQIFDISVDGVGVNFSDAWQQFKIKDISHFPDMPVIAVLAILLVMVLFHFVSCSMILNLLLRRPFNTDMFIQGIHSYLSPPLHLDWELLYRKDPETNTVLGCWKK